MEAIFRERVLGSSYVSHTRSTGARLRCTERLDNTCHAIPHDRIYLASSRLAGHSGGRGRRSDDTGGGNGRRYRPSIRRRTRHECIADWSQCIHNGGGVRGCAPRSQCHVCIRHTRRPFGYYRHFSGIGQTPRPGDRACTSQNVRRRSFHGNRTHPDNHRHETPLTTPTECTAPCTESGT